MYVFFIAPIFTITNFFLYNYNSLSVVLVLIILLYEIDDRNNVKNNIYIGFLLGFLFLAKQNICGGVVIASYLFLLLSSGLSLKRRLFLLSVRSLAATLPVFVYLIYLFFNDALYDFIEHVVLGPFAFSKVNVFTFRSHEVIFCILPLVIIARAVYLFIRDKHFQFDDKLSVILSYTIGMWIVIYPLFDFHHLSIASVLVFLLLPFIYSADKMQFSPFIRIIVLAFFSIALIYKIIFPWPGDSVFFPLSQNYRYVLVNQSDIQPIQHVLEYVEKKHREGVPTVFLDTEAMAFRTIQGIYDDPFDFLVAGNMGPNGEDKVLARIKQLKTGSLFLIGNDIHIQEMLLLRAYTVCNYEYVEEVSGYKVYRKPDVVTENDMCVTNKIELDTQIIRLYMSNR